MSNYIAFIDDKPYPVKPGEMVLGFLERHLGKGSVPTLCDAPNLKPFGSCRMCTVEMAREKGGATKVVASCHTPVSENHYFYPHTAQVQSLRKNIMELVLSDHPLDCLTCEVNGNCELQDVAAKVGIREVRYPSGANHLDREKDRSHPYMVSDLSKCINCYRCVRACDEVQGEFVLSMHGRGFDARIIKGDDTSFADSDCVSCGACAQACPTSAISDKYQSKSVVAKERVRTVCTYCGVGCNLSVGVSSNQVLSIEAPIDAEVNSGHTCLKGRFAFGFYNHPDRLRSPLIKKDGQFVECSWDDAYGFIEKELRRIRKDHGPDSIAGISSSRCTNEENYLMQKFIRAVMGTNNIDCCARVCHAPTAWGMQQSFGTGAATNSIKDLEKTELILLIGANPTSGHPVTGAKIKQRVMKGVPLIVIDPRKTELARYADYHLALRPGTNVALLTMMAYFIVKSDLVDEQFVKERCEDFEAFQEELRNIDLGALETVCGVNRKLVEKAAIAYAQAPRAMSFHGLGVTEHTQGSKTVMWIANLAMMTGNIGREGVGVNPLRGQNNVQGAADMGVQPHQGAGYLDVTLAEHQAHYLENYGVEVPKEIGLKIPQMFEASIAGKLKALWIMGEDVVQSDPNSAEVIHAMKSLELLVVQELFLSETAKLAHVVLPGASFLEKSGTFTNGERRVQRVNQAIEPLPGTKVDGQIIVDMMNRMGYAQPDYHPKTALEEISQVVPFFKGIRWDELGDNGKQWPVDESGRDTQILHQTTFKRGKGRFFFHPFEESGELIAHGKKYPFLLTTGRDLEHYNVGTLTRRTRNREILSEDVLVLHPETAQSKTISDGDLVSIRSARGEIKLRARVSDEVKPKVLYTTFHFPEVLVNNITSEEKDAETLCPEYKVVAVDIEKVSA